MRFKKGQTATEYLIILAVVIVIALIVVGVLGGIPGMGGGSKQKVSSAYWKTENIGIDSYAVDAASTSSAGNASGKLTIRNNFPQTVTVTDVKLTEASNSTHSKSYPTDFTLSPGETKEINFTNNLYNSGTLGESFSYAVQINYTDVETAATYSFTGTQKLEGEQSTRDSFD